MTDLASSRPDMEWIPPAQPLGIPRGWVTRTVFCLGTGAVTASQLRIAGPFGIGEFMILGWSIMTMLSPSWRVRASAGLWPTRVLGLYILLGLLGTPFGIIGGMNLPGTAARFVSALLLVGLFTLALTYHQDRAAIMRSWVKWWPVLAMLPNVLAYIVSRSSPTFAGLTFLDGDYATNFRFQGVTTNANQLAMLSACAFFLSLATAKRLNYRPWTLIMVVVSTAMGYLSQSDGWRVSFIAAGGAVMGLIFFEKRRTVWGALRLVGAWMVVIAAMFSVNVLLARADKLSSGQNNQGGERVRLWGKCTAVFLRYPLFGVGPTTPIFDLGKRDECHNSYLDIATGGGVFATFTMVALLVFLMRKHWQAADPIRLGMVTWLAAFMLFGYQGRHPIFWLILIWLAAPETTSSEYVERVRERFRGTHTAPRRRAVLPDRL
jgi:O-antigen ligase